MKDNSGKVLLALLAGASAGVIAGLLMAPDTGEATRSSVKNWAGKLSKDLEKNLQTGLDEIKRMSTDAYDKVAGGKDSSGNSGNEANNRPNQASGGNAGNAAGRSSGANAGAGSNAGGAGNPGAGNTNPGGGNA